MRIDHLKLTNFKGFATREFSFHPEFNLVVGVNGTGKTSLLDALSIALGSWFLGVRGEDSRHIRPEDVRVKVIPFGDTERIEHQFPVTVDADGRVMDKQLHWKRELSGKKTGWVEAKNIKQEAERAVEQMQRGEAVTLPLLSYYGTGRLWQEPKDVRTSQGEETAAGRKPAPQEMASIPEEEDLAASFSSRLAGYRYSIDPRCSPRELLRWLQLEQKLAFDRSSASNQYRIVKAAIQQAVEGCQRVDYDSRLGLLLDIEGQPRLPFGALSDGQRNMVAMIGDLAFKAAQLNPHLGEEVLRRTPGVVLIDELDLHLHPKWQRHVIEDLRRTFPKIQFICTTHSPFLIQTLRSGEELIMLEGQPVAEFGNLGIEAIAAGIMGVSDPEVSPRYREMLAAAKSYLADLDEASRSPRERLEEYKRQLADRLAPFADNPAFQAILELERVAKLGE